MTPKQMVASLEAFGRLAGGSTGNSLTKLATLFSDSEQKQATAIVTQVLKNWNVDGRAEWHPLALRDALELIALALESSGATAQAKVYRKTLEMFSGEGNQDVFSFVTDAVASRLKKAPPPKPKKIDFAQDVAPALAQELHNSSGNRNLFDALLNEYEAKYKAAELKAIAVNYLGYSIEKKKKTDLVKAVRNSQRESELNQDRRLSQAKAGL